MTQLLYFENNQLLEFEATVIDCIEKEDQFHIILDKTAFFPEGGGIASDQGTLDNTPVLHVYKVDNTVYHVLNTPLNKIKVTGKIDSTIRKEQAIAHSTQHLLSALFLKYYQSDVDSIIYSNGINAMDLIGIDHLTDEMITHIENEANQLIEDGSPIETWFEDDINYSSPKRVVNIVCCQDKDACGCIHVSDIKEIGMIKILDWEHKKSWVRINFVSGPQLLKLLNSYHNILTQQVSILSRPILQLNTEIQQKIEKQKQFDFELELLQKDYFTLVAKDLIQGEVFTCKYEPSLSTKKLQSLAACILSIADTSQACAIYNEEHFILISKQPHNTAKQVFKELQASFTIKGGGTDTLCQGKYNPSQIDEIVLSLTAILK